MLLTAPDRSVVGSVAYLNDVVDLLRQFMKKFVGTLTESALTSDQAEKTERTVILWVHPLSSFHILPCVRTL